MVNGWAVRHDRAATLAYYESVAQGDADRCGCSFCRNFALQRATAFPMEFLRLLERLGIDAAKEREAYMLGPTGDGLHFYGGWFCFIGEFARTEARPGSALDGSRFSFGFTDSFPWPADAPRETVAAVEFLTALPWLLTNERPL